MFVTMLCAVFQPSSGRLVLANGGHCRPVLLQVGTPPRWAVPHLGTALGFETGITFERTELTLNRGDVLVCFTDGVSEAFNAQEECYGADRLLGDVGTLADQSAAGITAGLLSRVRAFAGNAPQSDDIAILTVQVDGPVAKGRDRGDLRCTLELHATPQEVMRAVETLQDLGHQWGLGEQDLFRAALVLEETATNVVHHALQRNAQATFRVTIDFTGDALELELRDAGAPFDPTTVTPPERPLDEEAAPGGWGLQLVRRYIDDLHYRREAGENVLRLRKCLVRTRSESGPMSVQTQSQES
jgi:sigma-B regulation protein RsbU (phosphoserine phosphatase)